jgi:uncharacterized protein YuzE
MPKISETLFSRELIPNPELCDLSNPLVNQMIMRWVYKFVFSPVRKTYWGTKIVYDLEMDALNIIFRATTVQTKNLEGGIAVDYDPDGKLVGIRVLNATKHFGDEDIQEILRQLFSESINLSV